MREHRAHSGCIVVMDPGERRESWPWPRRPDFDPNALQDGFPPDARRNRAIADAYEPGSTFKIVTGALGARARRRLAGRDHRHGRRHDPRREHDDSGGPAPPLRRADAAPASSSTRRTSASSAWACGSGPRRLYEGAIRLRRRPADGRGSARREPGHLPAARRAGRLSRTASISMGQEVSLNALQLARITAVVANGGLPRASRTWSRASSSPERRDAAVAAAAAASGSCRRETAHAISKHPGRRRRPRHRREGRDPRLRGRRQDRHRAESRRRRLPGRAPRPELRRVRARRPPALRRGRRPRGAAGQVLRGRRRGAALRARRVAGARDPARRAARTARPGDRARSRPRPPRAVRSRRIVPAASRRGPRPVPPAEPVELPERTPSARGPLGAPGRRHLRARGRARAAPGQRASSSPRTRRRDRPSGRAPCTRSFSPTARTRRPRRPAAARRRRLRLLRLREADGSRCRPSGCRRCARRHGPSRSTRVASDSRRVRPGDLFVALRGAKFDGLAHVPEAVARGAVAVVSDRPAPGGVAVPWIRVEAPRRALALLAAELHGRPAERLVLAGVTGTNGKTSTTTLLEAILARRYGQAGLLATTVYRTPRRAASQPTARRPRRPLIQELLAELVADGVPAAAIEVSSHALVLDRVEGCRFDVAVFTNLTRDHLDFHGTMDEYYEAKKRLFTMRKRDGVRGGQRRRPVRPPAARRSGAAAGELLAVGRRPRTSGPRRSAATSRAPRSRSCTRAAASRWSRRCSAASRSPTSSPRRPPALCLGVGEYDIATAVAGVAHVPGRLERVEAGQPYPILVDYAHTPDALERLLSAVRELTDRKIILVFGCGGDRDRGKRAPMGEIAGRHGRHRDRDLRQSALGEPRGDPARGGSGPGRLGRDQVPEARRTGARRSGPPSSSPIPAPSSSSPARATRRRRRSAARSSRSTTERSPPSSRGSREFHARATSRRRRARGPRAPRRSRASRSTRGRSAPGDLFVAIRGARVDGHDFAREAVAAGREGAARRTPPGGPAARVRRPSWSRRRSRRCRSSPRPSSAPRGFRLAAITGSAGKTTTKDFAAAILARRLEVEKTPGNQNSQIGFAMSIVNLRRTPRVDGRGDGPVGEGGSLAPLAGLRARRRGDPPRGRRAPPVLLLGRCHRRGEGRDPRGAEARRGLRRQRGRSPGGGDRGAPQRPPAGGPVRALRDQPRRGGDRARRRRGRGREPFPALHAGRRGAGAPSGRRAAPGRELSRGRGHRLRRRPLAVRLRRGRGGAAPGGAPRGVETPCLGGAPLRRQLQREPVVDAGRPRHARGGARAPADRGARRHARARPGRGAVAPRGRPRRSRPRGPARLRRGRWRALSARAPPRRACPGRRYVTRPRPTRRRRCSPGSSPRATWSSSRPRAAIGLDRAVAALTAPRA